MLLYRPTNPDVNEHAIHIMVYSQHRQQGGIKQNTSGWKNFRLCDLIRYLDCCSWVRLFDIARNVPLTEINAMNVII